MIRQIHPLIFPEHPGSPELLDASFDSRGWVSVITQPDEIQEFLAALEILSGPGVCISPDVGCIGRLQDGHHGLYGLEIIRIEIPAQELGDVFGLMGPEEQMEDPSGFVQTNRISFGARTGLEMRSQYLKRATVLFDFHEGGSFACQKVWQYAPLERKGIDECYRPSAENPDSVVCLQETALREGEDLMRESILQIFPDAFSTFPGKSFLEDDDVIGRLSQEVADERGARVLSRTHEGNSGQHVDIPRENAQFKAGRLNGLLGWGNVGDEPSDENEEYDSFLQSFSHVGLHMMARDNGDISRSQRQNVNKFSE